MKRNVSIIILVFCLFFLASRSTSLAAMDWTPSPNTELEFGLTTLVGEQSISDPWVFESGYNGAAAIRIMGDNIFARGQTFKAPYEGALQSIELRVSDAYDDSIGSFEISIFEVNLIEDNIDSYTKIASLFPLAEDYRYDTFDDVPISSFDFSVFNIDLSLTKTYAFAVLPTLSLDGAVAVQGAVDIYPDGHDWAVTPEPSTLLIFSLGGFIFARKRKS